MRSTRTPMQKCLLIVRRALMHAHGMTPSRIIMDFEASALHKGYPIEVGVALSWPDGRVGHAEKLIRHDPWLENGHWCPEAQKVHRISRQRLFYEGTPVAEVCTWLNSLAGDTVIVTDFKDKGWLYQMFDAAHSVPLFEVRDISKEIESASVVREDDLRERMRQTPHRAGLDAVHIARTLDLCLD